MRLTGDAEDLASGRSNLFDHTRLLVAAQLAATGRSPEPSIEEQYEELVARHLGFEPTASHAYRGIEKRWYLPFRGIDKAELVAITGRTNSNLLACANLAITKNQPEFVPFPGFCTQRLFEIDQALLVIGSMMVISVLAALWPAWRASRLQPVDAMRSD